MKESPWRRVLSARRVEVLREIVGLLWSTLLSGDGFREKPQ